MVCTQNVSVCTYLHSLSVRQCSSHCTYPLTAYIGCQVHCVHDRRDGGCWSQRLTLQAANGARPHSRKNGISNKAKQLPISYRAGSVTRGAAVIMGFGHL